MSEHQPPQISSEAPGPLERDGLESLLAFWADAGVDACIGNAPIDRLAEGARRLQPPLRAAPPTQTVALGGERSDPLAPFAAASTAAAWEAAARAETLVELETAILGFEGCALKSLGARGAVFARGDPKAPVMIIGEGPGAEEDVQGAPFVGRAGKLLDRMVEAAGLTGQVFITNTVFWRPPGNRNPTAEEQAACAPFLERAIALVRPRLLMLAGGVSAKSLLRRDEGILSLHGRWFDWTSHDGTLTIPALPILHPAFLLRQPVAKGKAWRDMLTLMSRLDRLRKLDLTSTRPAGERARPAELIPDV